MTLEEAMKIVGFTADDLPRVIPERLKEIISKCEEYAERFPYDKKHRTRTDAYKTILAEVEK